jgi:DNA repair photolyase
MTIASRLESSIPVRKNGLGTGGARAGRSPEQRIDATAVAGAIKGRGTALSIAGRFESLTRETVDDGWQPLDAADEDGHRPGLQTRVLAEHARSIITRNRSPDIYFNLSINPYRGCEHGCIYCYARPNHSYVGLSPGLDFETRLFAKVNAPELFVAELAKESYQCEPINIGSVTDPYQPIEREFRLTRRLLEIALERRQPVTLITKGSLIERDMDVLAELARLRLASVVVTVTTLEAELARKLEPRASAPWRRMESIRRLASAGIPVGVSIGPIIPFINDHEIESLLTSAREAGARGAHYTVIRLPLEVSPLFQQWLQAHYPERANRVMHRIQDMREGRNYDPRFFSRMKGEGVLAGLIRMRFENTVRKLGLDRDRPDLRTDLFLKPPRLQRSSGELEQLTLI